MLRVFLKKNYSQLEKSPNIA